MSSKKFNGCLRIANQIEEGVIVNYYFEVGFQVIKIISGKVERNLCIRQEELADFSGKYERRLLDKLKKIDIGITKPKDFFITREVARKLEQLNKKNNKLKS